MDPSMLQGSWWWWPGAAWARGGSSARHRMRSLAAGLPCAGAWEALTQRKRMRGCGQARGRPPCMHGCTFHEPLVIWAAMRMQPVAPCGMPHAEGGARAAGGGHSMRRALHSVSALEGGGAWA